MCNYLQQNKLAGLSANQRFVFEVLHEITNIFECAMTKCDVSAGPHDVEMLDRMLELDRQCVLSASLWTGAQKVSSVFTVLEENTFCCMSREVWVKPVQWFDITTLLRHDYRAVDNTCLTVSWLSLKSNNVVYTHWANCERAKCLPWFIEAFPQGGCHLHGIPRVTSLQMYVWRTSGFGSSAAWQY